MTVVLEQTIRYSPLGIRFWDPVTDVQITDGLIVNAWPIAVPSQKRQAFKTIGNIFSFIGLPGLRDLESGMVAAQDIAEPDRRQFIVNVSDQLRRYVDISFDVLLPLPYNGVLLSENVESPVDGAPKGVYLYSTISRNMPRHFALVHGLLIDQLTGEPARHALIKVYTEDGETWVGISGTDGQFVVSLPYPSLSDGFGGSPAGGQVPLHNQSWNISLEVCYSPVTREGLPGTDIPNYVSILGQAVADMFPIDPDVSSSVISQLPIVLEFNRPFVTRSDGQTALYVRPTAL